MSFIRQFICALVAGSTVLPLATNAASLSTRKADAPNSPITERDGQQYQCKCYSSDDCWPAESDWSALNSTVGGNLQAVVPPGASCFGSFKGQDTYDRAACLRAALGWHVEEWQADQQVTNMWTSWTNNTCEPGLLDGTRNDECTLGFLPEYVVMAKTREHIKAGVDFARENNLRLLIRNTGHDFMGRSAGYGSLAINTHSFKDVQFIDYDSPSYTGGALVAGAGIQVREMYMHANNQTPPVIVVGGECPTVGVAGGYVQGGGHGPMSSLYGMGADNALSFDVLTVDGEVVTANAEENPDLFWALKGGGPSAFAVVLSVTLKTHPEVPTAGTQISVNRQSTPEVFWKAVRAFHNMSNRFVEHHMFVYYELTMNRLNIRPVLAPNMNAAELEKFMAPLFSQFDEDGVEYTSETKEFSTFFDLYIDMFQDEAAGVNVLTGGRLFTLQDIEEYGDEVVDSYKVALDHEAFTFINGHIVGPGFGLPEVENAIHPKWRNASSFTITMMQVDKEATWDQRLQAQDQLTNVLGKAMRDASPYGAAYVNEGDLEEPDWQETYWGSNYPRLLEIRQKWDPKGVLYARTTPGTEDWETIDQNTKLCKRIGGA